MIVDFIFKKICNIKYFRGMIFARKHHYEENIFMKKSYLIILYKSRLKDAVDAHKQPIQSFQRQILSANKTGNNKRLIIARKTVLVGRF